MKKYLLIVCVCLLASAAGAVELTGYYETDLIGLVKQDDSTLLADLNRFRLKIDTKLDSFALHLEPRYYFLLNSRDLPLAGATGLDQLTWDRVYLKYYSALFNLTAGKQRIAWGTGYIWNPTDVFNPFVLSFAVKEDEENNVEALRCEAPLGLNGGLDLYITTGQPWSAARKGTRLKETIGSYDLSLSYVDLGGGNQIGADAVGELWGWGVRGEVALKRPAGGVSYFQSVWGCDYTLENGLGLNFEYFFNGLGKKERAAYDWAGLASGNISQLAMDYLFCSANKVLDELTEVRGSLLVNLNDQGYIFYPQLTRSLKQNLDLSLEGLLSGGTDGSEFSPGPALDPSGFGGSRALLAKITWHF